MRTTQDRMNREAQDRTAPADAALPEWVKAVNPLVCQNPDCAGYKRANTRIVRRTANGVKRTRFDEDEQTLRRVRVCEHCGSEWTTVEVFESKK